MTLNSTTALVCAGIVLAGCGSSGDGGGGGGTQPQTGVSAIYDPNFRDAGETEYAALEEGLVYYIGATDGTVNEFRVRIDRNGTPGNASDDRLLVEQNDGPVIEYTPLQISDDGTTLSTTWVAFENTFDELQFQVIVDSAADPTDSSAFFRINFPMESIGPQNFGRGGLETQVANLPDSATYSGYFATDTLEFQDDPQPGNPNQQRAAGVDALNTNTSDLTVDFVDGSLAGTHSGTSFLGETDVAVNGNITGEVEGSRVGGSLSIQGGATGTLNFGGLFTGETGNNLVGGVAGTVQQDGTAHEVGGDFRLGQTSSN